VFRKEEEEKENISCPEFDEQYEDLIECMKCQRWWHEQCSSFEGDLTFKCDIC